MQKRKRAGTPALFVGYDWVASLVLQALEKLPGPAPGASLPPLPKLTEASGHETRRQKPLNLIELRWAAITGCP
jgi:hypothetical protein